MYMCDYLCICECRCLRGQKRACDPLELELQAIVSCLTWVLGTELRPSARALCILHCGAISLDLEKNFDGDPQSNKKPQYTSIV